ncbi:MAG: right-handed parallel beta-helix repeat-containing protein [Christensenellaceae bacterium]
MKTIKKAFFAVVSVLTVFAMVACSKGTDEGLTSQSLRQSSQSETVNTSDSSHSDSKSADASSASKTEISDGNSKNSTSAGGGNGGIDEGSELSYSQKIEAYLDGATVQDAAFVNDVKNLGEYDNQAKVVENAIFAAPKATGDGTKSNPCSFQDAIDSVSQGQTIYLRQGTYDSNAEGSYEGYFLNCKGASGKLITIRNYPGESVVITNGYVNNAKNKESNAIIVEATCQYVVLEGVEIAHVASYCAYGICMWEGGQNHLVIRNCTIHDIKTTVADPDKDANAGANAIIMFGDGSKSINNIFVMDNEIYNAVTGWSEVLSVTSNCEYVYVLGNKVHDCTNIGIDFYGNAGYNTNPSLDQPRYCVAAGNVVENVSCSYADCAGLYVDGARDIILQYNTVTNCQYGTEIGSEEKQEQYPVKNILVRNNVVHDNSIVGVRVGGYETNTTGYVCSTTVLNNTIYNNANTSGSAEIIIAKVDGISFVNNIVATKNSTNCLVLSEFGSDYTKNVVFNNNLFYAEGKTKDNAEFYMFNSSQQGLAGFEQKLGAPTGNNYYGNVTFDASFKPTYDGSYAAKQGENVGSFDWLLNKRIIDALELGAVEK